MPLTAKIIRSQMARLKPLWKNCSLETMRRGQNIVGELIEAKHRRSVVVKKHNFKEFDGAWVLPKDERRQGVILYLHGGGYICGDYEYAVGCGSIMAVETGARVFCPAYRLAPEYPFPAAVEDAVTAYQYLLDKGYPPDHITLCGESAGGGLCYALCLKLREMGMTMPCCIVGISPWTDLTLSGQSYEKNKDDDPLMTEECLRFFAKNYTNAPQDPFASPLFADLTEMPPSLIFAAENEVLLDDAVGLHQRLLAAGGQSKLVLTPERWHAYVLYGLTEDQKDFVTINQFLNEYMSAEKKLRWMRLDNAAKIYPAARTPNWSNVFRLSVTLKENIDTEVLRSALDVTVRRFPSIAARLRKGVFWYYLQELSESPAILEENSYPLARMSKNESRRCALRVIVYQKRLAVEFFHALTDGNGALIFLKSLTAEYLQQKYGVYIPAEHGVLGRLEEPSAEELEDSFQKYSGKISASRKENTAWHISGTPEPRGFLNLTCFQLPVKEVLEKAHEYNVSLTNFLCAAMMMALQNWQKEEVANPNRRSPIKVLIPVNLRNVFPSKSLRNFALYTTPEILPKLGEYSFEEICQVIKHRMGMDINQKQMSMQIAVNINSERPLIVRIMPLFLKNIVMKAVFRAVGERKSCLSLSNLGNIKLPEAMKPYIERMDFILGVQATAPYNCGVLSFGDTLYMNFIRDVRESRLEYHFYRVLQEMGLPVQVESNGRE